MLCWKYPSWFHWGHWISCGIHFPHSSLYEWRTNAAERCFNALFYMCRASRADLMGYFPPLATAARPASASDLIKSQSQRQLGQSNKLYRNADLMPSPAALFVCPYCHGSVHKQYVLKLDMTETE